MNFHVWNFILKFHLECWPFPSDLLMIFSIARLNKRWFENRFVLAQPWLRSPTQRFLSSLSFGLGWLSGKKTRQKYSGKGDTSCRLAAQLLPCGPDYFHSWTEKITPPPPFFPSGRRFLSGPGSRSPAAKHNFWAHDEPNSSPLHSSSVYAGVGKTEKLQKSVHLCDESSRTKFFLQLRNGGKWTQPL